MFYHIPKSVRSHETLVLPEDIGDLIRHRPIVKKKFDHETEVRPVVNSYLFIYLGVICLLDSVT